MSGLVQIASWYPKLFLHLICKFSLKTTKEDEELNMIYLSYPKKSGKNTDPDEPLAVQNDISTLSKSEEKISV